MPGRTQTGQISQSVGRQRESVFELATVLLHHCTRIDRGHSIVQVDIGMEQKDDVPEYLPSLLDGLEMLDLFLVEIAVVTVVVVVVMVMVEAAAVVVAVTVAVAFAAVVEIVVVVGTAVTAAIAVLALGSFVAFASKAPFALAVMPSLASYRTWASDLACSSFREPSDLAYEQKTKSTCLEAMGWKVKVVDALVLECPAAYTLLRHPADTPSACQEVDPEASAVFYNIRDNLKQCLAIPLGL